MGLHGDGADVGCLTDGSHYGFCVLDHRWRFTYVNELAEQILRKTRGELLGKGIWGLYPEASKSAFHEACRNVVESQAGAFFDNVRFDPDIFLGVYALPIETRLALVLVRCGTDPPPYADIPPAHLKCSTVSERTVRSDPDDTIPTASPLSPSVFLGLTLDRAFSSLLDVKTFTEALAREDNGERAQSPCHLLDCPRLTTLTDALTEAIRVLEMTKGSFKSRELGDLRNRLEKVIRDKRKDL